MRPTAALLSLPAENVTYTLTQVWFTLFAAYSGQRFYDDWYQSTYNLFFTSIPVFALGLLDQDVKVTAAKAHPGLYMAGVRNSYFNAPELARWIVSSIWASLVIFFLAYFMFEGADSADGRMSGQWSAATAAYTYVVLVVNVRVATCVNFLTSWHHIVIWGSIAFWIVFAFGYNGMTPSVDGFPPRGAFSVFGLIQYLFGTPRYFLGALLCVPAALLPDIAHQAFQRYLAPMDYQIVQEMIGAKGKAAKDAGTAAMLALRKAGTDADAEAGDGKPCLSGLCVGGIVGVSGKRHTGYAFEHPPGVEGSMTLFTGGKDGDTMRAAKSSLSAADIVSSQAEGRERTKRRSSVIATDIMGGMVDRGVKL